MSIASRQGPGRPPFAGAPRRVPAPLRAALACAVGLALVASPCAAAEGLYLTWGDCALGGAGTQGHSIPCNSDLGDSRLYLAFSLSQPVDQVLGIEVVVDLQSSVTPLPDWWHFEFAGPQFPTPGCRAGLLGVSRDFSTDHTCVDPWAATTGGAVVQSYTPGQPRGLSSQARILATASASTGTVPTLDATDQYYALKLVISNSMTSTCTGCAATACLVLNSIWLRRPLVPNGDILLTTPGPSDANWARWQMGTVVDCTAVPVERSTWGRIKTQYRY